MRLPMSSRRLATAVALLFGVGLVGAAEGQESGGLKFQQGGGVKIQGNTRIDANAQDVNTLAIGQGNVAHTNIGAIKSSRSGNSNVAVDVKNVQNVVAGRNRKGCVNIGSTPDPACQ
ncbi:MAG: hypothetical protein K2Q10_00045 [Rhodospirillales bacterium]|nr:hypothetical protein [Rhodospirillales bacterium]